MTEPEAQTEESELTESELPSESEFAEEVRSTNPINTDVSEDASTEIGDANEYGSANYNPGNPSDSGNPDDPSNPENPSNPDMRGRKKRKVWIERCVDKRWISEGESLWSIYMKSYAESRLEAEKEDERKISPDVAWLIPRTGAVEETSLYECFPLGGFKHEHRAGSAVGLNRCSKTRIWTSMRRQPTKVFGRRGRISRTGSGKWPGVWPCLSRDVTREGRGKRRDVFPCEPMDDREEMLLREQRSDFANRKELGHVRAPVVCPEAKRLSVDRAAGECPGLVDGDYVIVELDERDSKRTYANVIIRGLKGMHLPELGPLRERKHTWKFCFYQAIAALLAKTQLRYKYAWSANIDYIYDHAWTLYAHIGAINVNERQRLDDVVVYNYKYNIEIELIQEMKDTPIARNVDFNYVESGLKRQITLRRKDPLKVRVEIGCEKVTDLGYVPVHEDVRDIEEWLDKLPARCRNCIFRTTRFSLAFWQDCLFWYVYNPYRCDEFGFWDDNGRACIVKFCTKDSLRRHLMILLLRAYAYDIPRSRDSNRSEINTLDVQIFHVTFHRCQLQNVKLLQRRPLAEPPRCADVCPSVDILDVDATDCDAEDDPKAPRERSTWLKRHRITWGVRAADTCRKGRDSVKVAVSGAKAKWHQYYVEEPNGLFSLWGEIHITDDMFDISHRGMQTYACYMICAGMTRIMAPEYWSTKILDVIVMCGDRYYARSKRDAEIKSATESDYDNAHVNRWDKYLADRFKIGETLFEARILPAVRGRLYGRSSECLWRLLERVFYDHHFAILTCESACLGLFKFCGAYYMCDVNSFGPPLFEYGHGVAYLMRATSFRKYVTMLVLTVGSSECSRFDLNPIEILKIVQVDPACKPRAKMTERRRDRLWKFAGKVRTYDGPKRKMKT